jgi:hypothetical protein
MSNRTYDSTPASTSSDKKLQGPANLLSQRHVIATTGRVKTPAEAGDSGKCSTPKPY